MITPEQHAEIRRLYFGEHWKVGTIAATLGVHHDTVSAAIAHDTQALRRGRCGPTLVDPYVPFLRDTLAQYPRLRATRLFEMVRARGYPGSVVQLRRVVRTLRPSVTSAVVGVFAEDSTDVPSRRTASVLVPPTSTPIRRIGPRRSRTPSGSRDRSRRHAGRHVRGLSASGKLAERAGQ